MTLPASFSPIMTLVTLVLSVFLAGSFFGGDFRYRQELKAEIKEAKAEQDKLMAQIQETNQQFQKQRLEYDRQTLEFYKTLESIATQKQDIVKSIQKLQPKIADQKRNLQAEIGILEDLLDKKVELKDK